MAVSRFPAQDQELQDNLDEDIYFYGRKLPLSNAEVDQFNQHALTSMESIDFRPRELHIQVSKRCNMQCTMCSWQTWESNTGLMDRALFTRALSQASEYGIRKIVFANAQGEPFLHPNILDMIEESVKAGFWTMVSTNGTPFTRDKIQRLAESGIHNIQFSFSGYDKSSYESVYVGGHWEQVTRNLIELANALRDKNDHTTLVINGCYASSLTSTIAPNAYFAKTTAFLRAKGLIDSFIQIRLQLPHNFGGNIHADIEHGSFGTHSYFESHSRRPGLCRVLQNAPGIYHDGRVTACGCLDPNGELTIGNITNQSIASIRKGERYQQLLNTFTKGDITSIPLCRDCDVPFYDNPEEAPQLWRNLMKETTESSVDNLPGKRLYEHLMSSLTDIISLARLKLSDTNSWQTDHQERLIRHIKDITQCKYQQLETANAVTDYLYQETLGISIFQQTASRPIKRLAIAPATKSVLENLDWFLQHFEQVVVADNFKKGQVHFGQEVIGVDQLLAREHEFDAFMLSTDTPEIVAEYMDKLPKSRTLTISDFSIPINWYRFSQTGLPRAQRILREIEASANPLVVLGAKLLATAEPMFVALENAGFDVFVISLWDKMENRHRTGYDDTCEVHRNVLVTAYEQLHILTHLRKGQFWIYYDFFQNVGWNVANSVIAYGYTATLLKMASRPVILGMYDVIKPVCLNMDQQDPAFALYKVMLDQASAVVLTSKSEHIADYLRNTLVKDRPVFSFYRYSFPPRSPQTKLSALDGERHIVGVTSFLGEVFEPNRIETRNSIRSILRQKIHFHYYSDNPKVIEFQQNLSASEQPYFHLEKPIWDQRELVYDMSRFDAGWLVGDEASIFAKLICDVTDRHIREIFTLFVPNGVPTSSMTYGAAGLAVFISRQIKVMLDVYPKGCCIPLDMGEVDELSNVVARMDWTAIHHRMREESWRFDIYAQINRLATFLIETTQVHSSADTGTKIPMQALE